MVSAVSSQLSAVGCRLSAVGYRPSFGVCLGSGFAGLVLIHNGVGFLGGEMMGFFDRLLKPNIGKLESHGDVEALAKLVETDDRHDLRITAIEALARIGGPEATKSLVRVLSDDDPDVAKTAEKAVGSLGLESGSLLIGALGGPGGDAVLGLLLNLGDEAVELLRGACSDQDEAIRLQALGALVDLDAGLDNDEVRESLFRALLAALGDRSAECRVLAATRLEALGNPKAGRALASQLKDGDDTVRMACRQALLAIGEPAVPYLLDALGDRNTNSRRLAAELLGEVCGGEIAIDSRRVALLGLIDRTSDSNAEIAAAVHQSLETIPSDAVIATQLEWLADPERSDHEEIEEFLTQMLIHCPLEPERKRSLTERLGSA